MLSDQDKGSSGCPAWYCPVVAKNDRAFTGATLRRDIWIMAVKQVVLCCCRVLRLADCHRLLSHPQPVQSFAGCVVAAALGTPGRSLRRSLRRSGIGLGLNFECRNIMLRRALRDFTRWTRDDAQTRPDHVDDHACPHNRRRLNRSTNIPIYEVLPYHGLSTLSTTRGATGATPR